jgi:hypothetical protein
MQINAVPKLVRDATNPGDAAWCVRHYIHVYIYIYKHCALLWLTIGNLFQELEFALVCFKGFGRFGERLF